MWERSMRRGRPAKMIDPSWFGPTIPASLLVTLKNRFLRQAYGPFARRPPVSP